MNAVSSQGQAFFVWDIEFIRGGGDELHKLTIQNDGHVSSVCRNDKSGWVETFASGIELIGILER